MLIPSSYSDTKWHISKLLLSLLGDSKAGCLGDDLLVDDGGKKYFIQVSDIVENQYIVIPTTTIPKFFKNKSCIYTKDELSSRRGILPYISHTYLIST